MSQLHKFKVEHEAGAYYPWQAKCFIDDKNVKIRGYTLEHYVDGVPKLNIDMQVDAPDIENVEAEIKIANKEEIAALMDREEFEEFCKIWERMHNFENEHNSNIKFDICETNPDCEENPSDCGYAVECSKLEDVGSGIHKYMCGRDKCKYHK